jgi:hypothetical protein
MQWAVLLGGLVAVRRMRHLQAICLGGMQQCGIVGEEGSGATDNAGVMGRGV